MSFEDIVIEELIKVVGKFKPISVTKNDNWINVTSAGIQVASFRIDGDNFILYDSIVIRRNSTPSDHAYKFSDENMFRSYVAEHLKRHLPTIIEQQYKSKKIKELPETMKDKANKVQLDRLTNTWFEGKFNEVTSLCMNSETAQRIEIHKVEEGVEIDFEINCGRYGRHDGRVSVNDRGGIKINLDETPIEGSEVEGELKKSISKLILK